MLSSAFLLLMFSHVENKDPVAIRDEPDNSSVGGDVKNTCVEDPYRYRHVALCPSTKKCALIRKCIHAQLHLI